MPAVPQAMVQLIEDHQNADRQSYLPHRQYARRRSGALNEELQFAIATRPENSYLHAWRPDDIIIWDNRAVLHRGHPYDEVNDRRLMIRTTIAGVAPTVVDGRIQAGA